MRGKYVYLDVLRDLVNPPQIIDGTEVGGHEPVESSSLRPVATDAVAWDLREQEVGGGVGLAVDLVV